MTSQQQKPPTAKKRTRGSSSAVLILVLLSMVGVVLWWNAYINLNEYRTNQADIAVQSVQSASVEITQRIENLKTSLKLLIKGHQELFQKLAQNPDDTAAYDRIAALLEKYFPSYYAFTLADDKGEVIYDDFEEQVGKRCRQDIRKFVSSGHKSQIYVHPGPGAYHFDIMLSWTDSNARPGVLFVSFKLSSIARILYQVQAPGHKLVLLHRNIPNLVEVTSQGSRDKLSGAFRLNSEQLKRVLYTKAVEGTRWNLVDLHSKTLFSSHTSHQVTQVVLAMALFSLICLIMYIRIHSEEKGRLNAEQALRQSCSELEQRVETRTHELLKTNEDLQQQIEEKQLAQRQALKLSRAIEQTDDYVMITDRDGVIEYVNPAFVKVTGYKPEELLGQHVGMIKSNRHDKQFYARLWNTILDGRPFREVFINRRKDGSLYYEEKTITPLKDESGEITHFVSTGKNITDRIEYQERLEYLAHHDVLTGLANRMLLNTQLHQALEEARRNNLLAAILFLDLDRFKNINDSLGHSVGDSLLQAAAKRLSDCVREGDSLGRLGGDEFIIVLNNIHHVNEITEMAEKILHSFVEPFYIDEHELLCTTSIGITVYPFDDTGINALLKNAGTAMYTAKSTGGNVYRFFGSSMNKDIERRVTMENALHHALDRNEFAVYYQPRIDICKCTVTGAEALLRWNNPVLGEVSPVEFIPVLEETGRINGVGEWVLRTACTDFQRLPAGEFNNLHVSVNMSPRQFHDKQITQKVSAILRESRLDVSRLGIEITESLLMDNIEIVTDSLDRLHAMGIRIAIDDFGTGYSALSYLKRFPIDCLKVDRSFVKDMLNSKDETELVKAIIAMAHSLEMNVVAEGVENLEQLRFLQSLGCEEIQGYLFARPLPFEEFKAWLKTADEFFAELSSLNKQNQQSVSR